MALGLHTAAPRITAAYAAYDIDDEAMGVENCTAWVDFRGKAYCDVDELRQVVERGVEERGYVS